MQRCHWSSQDEDQARWLIKYKKNILTEAADLNQQRLQLTWFRVSSLKSERFNQASKNRIFENKKFGDDSKNQQLLQYQACPSQEPVKT